jgi:uncharacterized protein (TIGR02117 family)
MKRRWVALAAVAGAIGVWFWSGENPRVRAASASDGDCVEIALWNNGFHTDLTFPADVLPLDHPLRQLAPDAKYLLVGWGDERFFMSDGTDMWLGAQALLPGGATTINLVAGDQPVATFYRPKDLIPVAISGEGAAALAQRFADTLQLDPSGAPQIIAPGHGGPRSWFLKARGEFNLFEVCNQWTARTLRAAGIKVNAAFLYTGDMVAAAVKPHAKACQTPPAITIAAPSVAAH